MTKDFSVAVIPQLGLCAGAVSLWQQCVEDGSVYSISAESFLATLSTIYSSIVPGRADSGTTTCMCVYIVQV